MSLSPSALYALADKTASDAVKAFDPSPMVVVQRENGFDDSSPIVYQEVVPDGPCGFAWINVPGNSAFGRYAKQRGHRKGYPQGVNIWVSNYGQSYQKKMVYAQAFAGVLKENGVEKAYASGRLD